MPYIGSEPGQKDIAAYTNIGTTPAGSDELLLSDAGVLKAVTVTNLVAAASGGKVLQVVYGDYSGQTSATSDTYIDTGLTAAITTAATNNKVLVIVQQRGCGKAADTGINLRLLRASSELVVFEHRGGYTASASNNAIGTCGVVWLDTPGSAAEHTYKTQMASYSDINTAYAQWVGDTAESTITLIELEY